MIPLTLVEHLIQTKFANLVDDVPLQYRTWTNDDYMMDPPIFDNRGICENYTVLAANIYCNYKPKNQGAYDVEMTEFIIEHLKFAPYYLYERCFNSIHDKSHAESCILNIHDPDIEKKFNLLAPYCPNPPFVMAESHIFLAKKVLKGECVTEVELYPESKEILSLLCASGKYIVCGHDEFTNMPILREV